MYEKFGGGSGGQKGSDGVKIVRFYDSIIDLPLIIYTDYIDIPSQYLLSENGITYSIVLILGVTSDHIFLLTI